MNKDWVLVHYNEKFTSRRFKHFTEEAYELMFCKECGNDVELFETCKICGSKRKTMSRWKQVKTMSMESLINRFGKLCKGDLAKLYKDELGKFRAFDTAVPEGWLQGLCDYLHQNKGKYCILLTRWNIFWCTWWVYGSGEPYSVCSDVNQLIKDYHSCIR